MKKNRINITIVEDEFAIAEDLRQLVNENGYEVLSLFDNGEDAAEAIVKQPPDLLLVDIRLAGKMTGIELVKAVKKQIRLPVIYITANSDHDTYQMARSTLPNAFLIKPFMPPNLLAAIDLALYNYATNTTPEKIERAQERQGGGYEAVIHKCLFVRLNGVHQKICPDDILFVQADGSYVQVQTLSGRFTLAQNLNSFFGKAPIDHLVRVHRSYLVNVNRVDSFVDNQVYISDHAIPISNTYKSAFLARVHCL